MAKRFVYGLALALGLCQPVVAAAGIADNYPGDVGIAGDPAVIFFDNFELDTGISSLWSRYENFYQQHNFRIATDAASVFSGQKSLEITQPAGSTPQYNALTQDISPLDTIFVRFHARLNEGFSFSSGDAVHNGINISGGYSGPGGIPNGRDFFLVALENTTYRGEPQPGYTHAYVYHPEQRSGWGDHWYSDGIVIPGETQGNFGPGFVPRPLHTATRGAWYSVELMIKLNTPGARDGRVSAWIDGVLIADWPNLRFRDVDTLKITRVELVLGAPNNAEADRVGVDNLVLATQYIGPMVTSGPPPPPPPPPPTGPQALFDGVTAPGVSDGTPWVLGTVFQSAHPGKITAVRVYAVQGETGSHRFRLWNNQTGQTIGNFASFNATGPGWKQYTLPVPIRIQANVPYTVSVTTGGDRRKYYAAAAGALTAPGNNGRSLSYPANAGVFGTVLNARPTQVWKSTNYLRSIVFVAD